MRTAGILMHISSLPNDSIGTLGSEAYRFIDFLVDAKQSLWQILPLNPTSYGDSPYQSASVYACNPYFISLDELVKEGLLAKEDYQDVDFGKGIDYGKLFNNKIKVLKKAYQNKSLVSVEFKAYKKKNAFWLFEYALYTAIKEKFDYKPWYHWDNLYKVRDEKTLLDFKQKYATEIEEVCFIQFLFNRQWTRLKEYANNKGIKIIGDSPIYAAYDSVDVWSNPSLFQLNDDLSMISVAGCPPDYFSPDGQLWGNPLYDWDKMAQDDYAWWVSRIKKTASLYDILRIDHFRGFAGYFSIPYGDKPCNGVWKKGPGYSLFREINKLKKVSIIAENLGFLDEDVESLLASCRYPGMNVTQFEFGDKLPFANDYPYNNVMYTSTHDNMNLLAWYNEQEDQKIVQKICGFRSKNPHLHIIEATMAKKCKYAVIPIQDYLGLVDGRMNTPSVLHGNWLYQVKKEDLSTKLRNTIKRITIKTKRDA